jgi:hypothetical protein
MHYVFSMYILSPIFHFSLYAPLFWYVLFYLVWCKFFLNCVVYLVVISSVFLKMLVTCLCWYVYILPVLFSFHCWSFSSLNAAFLYFVLIVVGYLYYPSVCFLFFLCGLWVSFLFCSVKHASVCKLFSYRWLDLLRIRG